MTEVRYGFIGGEASHRNFFGGTMSNWRLWTLGVAFVLAMVLTVVGSTPGFVTAAVLFGVVYIGTSPTVRGSIIERQAVRHRWRTRRRTGTDTFLPFDPEGWERLCAATEVGSRRERKMARRAQQAMRQLPDGADGMGWLQTGSGRPGIAWHTPLGEEPYLSVTWEVDGQIHGIESITAESTASRSYGRFLARFGAATSVPAMVQCITRVLPPDSMEHERWLLENMDPDAPSVLLDSYNEVLREIVGESMVQRHFITVRWPLTSFFRSEARRFGRSEAGWTGLVMSDVEKLTDALYRAGFAIVQPLSARRVAAVILHQQNPTRPLDMVADVELENIGIPSYDRPGYYATEGTDPLAPEVTTPWYHQTLRIESRHMDYVARRSLWWLAILRSSTPGTALTLAFDTWIVPAAFERRATVHDVTRDMSNKISRAGHIDDGQADRDLDSAERRRQDLNPQHGQNHQGARWVGYLSLSAQSIEELDVLSINVQEACSNAGINKLEPLLAMQSSAAGCTWPIGRGMRPPAVRAQGLARVMAGTENEEGL